MEIFTSIDFKSSEAIKSIGGSWFGSFRFCQTTQFYHYFHINDDKSMIVTIQ